MFIKLNRKVKLDFIQKQRLQFGGGWLDARRGEAHESIGL